MTAPYAGANKKNKEIMSELPEKIQVHVFTIVVAVVFATGVPEVVVIVGVTVPRRSA